MSFYQSDTSVSDIYYRAVDQEKNIPRPHRAWSYWKNFDWKKSKWEYGGGQLLRQTDSPTISACTTSTNLSNLEFQSNQTINKYIKGMNLEENLRRTLPEIEPLQMKKDTERDTSINNENDSSDDLCQSSKKTNFTFRQILPQLIAALTVSWVSMIIGYASAYTSPAIPSLKRDLEISDKEVSWIGGLMPLMALCGGLIGGPLIDNIGRKWTLFVTSLLFLAAWTVNYFAINYWFMYVSRMLVGSGVGIASLTLPVYLGETVQPEVRGTLGLLPTAFGNIGILLCFLLGNVLEWRGLAGVGIILPLPFYIIFWLIPETPRWYISKGRVEESRKALNWLRSKTNEDAVNKEFEELLKSQKVSDEKSTKLADLASKANVKPLLIVLGLMFFQQLSGINAIIFYTTQIFEDTGSSLKPSVCTTIVGVVNFISTFIATVLIDRLGRKALLYISSVAMIITTGILGTYFYLLNVARVDITAYGWLPLASFVIYVLGFSLGFGPIPWLMMGELLPARIRGPAASISTGFNWACTSVVTTTFPLFKDIIGQHGVFWLFGSLTIIGLIFTILCVPETRGQSLEDIERKLAGVKVRRMSSVANLKPLQSTF